VHIKTISKAGFVVLLIGLVLFALGGVAFATTGQNGPTPPSVGDPVGTDVSPHGGFSSSTDYCVQCHSVHNTTDTSAGAYALLWKSSVTETCNTCHAVPGLAYGAADGARDSNTLTGFTAGVMGTASSRSAYDNPAPAAEHGLGSLNTNSEGDNVAMQDSGWSYHGSPTTWAANTQDPQGLTCTSCHEAHGNWGALINSERGVIRTTADGTDLSDTDAWVNDAPIYVGATLKYLHLNGSVWQGCTATGGGGTCTDLTTTDSEGQTVYLYGYKLLSAYPNFSWDNGGESWGVDTRAHDQARWCGECHTRHTPSEFGGTYHNHPTGCTACHGNPASDPTSKDFPHTSTFGNFLTQYPDGLCIGSCHTAGSLP
jgi:hypothetical protein